MTKLYLCGITSAGKVDNLKALIDPIREYVDGLQWTFHLPTDEGADYLESQKGDGRIVYSHFSQRHGFSMTNYLWQGTMKDGDRFIQIDDLERLSPAFMKDRLQGFLSLMDESGVAMIANYGKGLIYQFNEQLEFRGSPHWYATGLDGPSINVELDATEFWNVRGQQRDPFQFVTHYLKYYLYPAGSNHCLLGLEKNGDPQKLFGPREQRRLDFRKGLLARGYPLTIEGVQEMMVKGLDSEMQVLFSREKILNDAWRHLHLGRTDFKDDHDFNNMIQIEPSTLHVD